MRTRIAPRRHSAGGSAPQAPQVTVHILERMSRTLKEVLGGRTMVVPLDPGAIRRPGARVAWDIEIYGHLIRWGNGSVVSAIGPVAGARALASIARLACRSVRPVASLRRSWPVDWLGNRSQLLHLRVPPSAALMFGNITFPVAVGTRLPVLWSTQGVIEREQVTFFPDESGRTHDYLMGRATLTQCWSNLGLAGLLARRPHLSEAAVRVVPPLVQIDLPPPAVRNSDDVEVLFVGAPASVKGLPVALEAMRRAGPGLRMSVICSDPPPTALPSNVTWLGRRPHSEVLARFQAADIHLFISRAESFGVAALEAMAAGLAQVVDRRGVPAELAGAGARTVDGSDPGDVLAALEDLASDREVRRELGAAGFHRYHSSYSPEVVGPQIVSMVADIVANRV